MIKEYEDTHPDQEEAEDASTSGNQKKRKAEDKPKDKGNKKQDTRYDSPSSNDYQYFNV